MKNVIGLEIYRDYQKQMEEIRHKVMESRSENDNDTALLLVHNDEERQEIVKYFGITAITIIIVASLFLAFIKSFHIWQVAWLIPVMFLIWGIVFIVLFSKNKKAKKQILENKDENDRIENSVVMEFKELQEQFYSIVLYVICINEYYHVLIALQGEERDKKWKQILDREMQAINQALHYNISIAAYQQYFSAWLATQEVYG